MIKTIIFDIGNVLAKYDWQGYLKRFDFTDCARNEIAHAVFLNPLWLEFDRGVMGDHTVIKACKALLPQYQNEMDQVFSGMRNLLYEYDYSAQWVKSLKEKGYQVYVLSNYGRTLFGYARSDFEFLKYIDGGIISYEVHCLKPEARIYELLIEKYDINPCEAVFLDDTFTNLLPAEKLGMNTIHVTSHQVAIEGLEMLGVETDKKSKVFKK
jgi:putative hydrolase of the HAD superfamily